MFTSTVIRKILPQFEDLKCQRYFDFEPLVFTHKACKLVTAPFFRNNLKMSLIGPTNNVDIFLTNCAAVLIELRRYIEKCL